MSIELRPLRLGEILDRMFHLYRERFLLFLGIAGVSTLLELIWSVGQLAFNRGLNKPQPGSVHQLVSSGLTLIAWAVSFGAAALATAATNRAVLAIYEERPTSVAEAYGELRGRWLTCAWVNILGFFIAWSPLILVGAAAFASVLIAKNAQTLTGANSVTAAFGIAGIVAFLVFPFCFWLMLRYSLAIPACVQERIGTLRSLKRSVLLSRGSRGRIFVLLLVVGVAWYIPLMVFMIPTFFFLAKNRGHVAPLGVTIYVMGVSFFVNMLMKPVYGIGLTLLYLDERVRKEGFDVEWMMEHTTQPATPEVLPGPAVSPDNLITG
jgi:hypothetical protein